MRKSFWIGLILLVVGLVVALRGASYNENKGGIGIGDTQVRVVERHGVPNWVGWTIAGVGLVVILTSFRGRPAGQHFEEHGPTTP